MSKAEGFFLRTGNSCCHLTEGNIYKGYQEGYYYTVIMDNGEESSPHYGGFEEINILQKLRETEAKLALLVRVSTEIKDEIDMIGAGHIGAEMDLDLSTKWENLNSALAKLNSPVKEVVEVHYWKSEKHKTYCADEYRGHNPDIIGKGTLIIWDDEKGYNNG